jgi:hypothetical protein
MSRKLAVTLLILAVLVLASIPALVLPESVSAAVWQTQVVDSGLDMRFPSMVLDSSGYPRISYYHFGAGALKYAVYNGSTWQTQTIASSGNMGRGNSLALDGVGNPHISCVRNQDQSLWHIYWDGLAWHQEMVYLSGAVAPGTSLAFNHLGYPCISFSNGNNGLKYAHWNGSSWQIDTIYNGYVGWFTSLAFDPSGDPHISFYSFSGELMYASWNGSVWSSETVDYALPGGGTGEFNSLALDSSGNPHIAYSCSGCPEGGLNYAYRDNLGWHTEVVDSTPNCVSSGGGPALSLRLDSLGNPRISYGMRPSYAEASILRYAYLDGSSWHTETVGSGDENSLALDSSGTPHVSYYQGYASTTKSLMYATRMEPIPATIDLDPNTINLKSKGNYVTDYIELPEGYDAKEIDISSVRLNGTVPALAKPTAIGDYDKDGKPDLMVKFDRAAVQQILAVGDQVEVTISGKVLGIDFEGSDIVKVIG